jgi:aldehyde:ferredoxin oxidoreductase
MKTKEMRAQHDTIPEWVFHDPSDKPVYTKGTIHMDKDDIKLAMDMYYQEMGWDRATGAPTTDAYRKLGLAEVADNLGEMGLLPQRIGIKATQ